MTVRVKIENASNSPRAILIDKGDPKPLALRPGESEWVTVWDTHPVRIAELSDDDKDSVVWLTTRATE